jgi:predicted TIM-barrel fold metal-dependent hydrolase
LSPLIRLSGQAISLRHTTYDPEILRFLINFVRSDRVVIGTDNAFGTNGQALEYPHTLIEQLNLPAVDYDLILRGNAARLFHL